MLIWLTLADASIMNLLVISGPSAILGRVPFFIINALQCEAGMRLQSHVCKECREILAPSFADCDSSGTVVFICRVVNILAALLHVVPCSIFGSAMRMAVSFAAFAQQLFLEAATGISVASSKMARHYRKFIAAITSTTPTFTYDVFQGDKSSESPAQEVCSWWSAHRYSLTRLSVKG